MELNVVVAQCLGKLLPYRDFVEFSLPVSIYVVNITRSYYLCDTIQTPIDSRHQKNKQRAYNLGTCNKKAFAHTENRGNIFPIISKKDNTGVFYLVAATVLKQGEWAYIITGPHFHCDIIRIPIEVLPALGNKAGYTYSRKAFTNTKEEGNIFFSYFLKHCKNDLKIVRYSD